MPWTEEPRMSSRRQFVDAVLAGAETISEQCRRFGISRKTGYKWLTRYQALGDAGLEDASRRPRRCRSRTPTKVEARAVSVREKHPAWGGRKIHAVLHREGCKPLPAPSTITGILRRHGLIDPEESRKHRPSQRFEREAPNQLWQMDFKGHFPVDGGRCHPLTMLYDHSRFLLRLVACAHESRRAVERWLRSVFGQYGLPEAMLMDNGSPWGQGADHPYTRLTMWLMRLGVRVIHSRPYHPQTQGKEERLHRTLAAELLSRTSAQSLEEWQHHFDRWRSVYNHERPHEALGIDVPASRYQPSRRAFPDELLPIEYPSEDPVRKVDKDSKLDFRNQVFRIGRGFVGQRVGRSPTPIDGVFDVYFCRQRIKQLDLRLQLEP